MRNLAVQSDIGDIVKKVEQGTRLSFDDGVRLLNSNSLLSIGWAADLVRQRLNGDRTYYIVNRHINYTNVCRNKCKFCAFSRREEEPGAYTMSVDEVIRKAVDARKDADFTELHLVGGLHPDLPFDYYLQILSKLKALMPEVHLQAFTAVEIAHFAQLSRQTTEETLSQLKSAGLGSLPGGGAEVFAERIREQLCPEKLPSDQWLEVMRTAHGLGIKSNATMLYGHIETPEEQIEHLIRLRELQDETSGFMAFIPLSYHPEGTELGEASGRRRTSGMQDLQTIAVSRLMLDNFPHIKSFWIMLGIKLAQVSLHFGADDFDGTVVEEKITHMAGADTPQGMTVSDITALIRETGAVPVERDTLYNEVRR